LEPTSTTANCISTLLYITPALITSGAILTSALLATIAAKVGINHQRAIARKRAVLDLILRCDESDFQELVEDYCKIRDGAHGLERYAAPSEELSPGDLESVSVIDRYLNHYEIVSVGISQDILDKETYELWMRSAFVNDWDSAREYIVKVRKQSPRNAKNFTEYEALAIEWGGQPLPSEQVELDLESTK
jgi:uncharacterized protein DUF4760